MRRMLTAAACAAAAFVAPPVADAGLNQIVRLGSIVTVSGSADDASGDLQATSWSFVTRPAGSTTA